ncbi:MAG TPA: glycoside hydrolase family 44 protein [Ignavibacteriaceae bacterium]|nr:glycoside hydrolase family 44 protein [Ignavibacteriaceae bacterium]
MKIIKLLVLFSYIGYLSNVFPQPVNFNIYVKDSLNPISPYIYGTNQLLTGEENWTALRQGGNRMTGYNWENNASNAGSDYFHSSDNYLTWISGIQNENEPGIVTTTFRDKSIELNAYSLVTLQLAGFVAKDKNGTVSESETAPSSRWAKVQFVKGSAFSLQPNTSDTLVYLDEYVNFLVDKYGTANTSTGIKGYSLDNEPGLWVSTHPRIHPLKATCSEIVLKGIDASLAVKNIDPYAEIFGPVLYGFNAYYSFQDAPDWNSVKSGKNYSWFIDYYLDEMKKAETDHGKRLLDVLDLHWYPEAVGDGRISDPNSNSNADKLARVQAPRSLWDNSYTEESWIGQWFGSYLPLIPKLKESIAKYYPGTKLAFTEFTYGGENDVSGAIAMADVLGIFGKYEVYFATFWELSSPSNYVSAAYKIFRNYDGNNSTAGDYYLPSSTSDSVNSSVYGSIKKEGNEIHLIVINKKLNESLSGNFSIATERQIISGRVWKLDGSSSEISETDPVSNISSNSFNYNLPAGSVCHFVLQTGLAGVAEKNIIPKEFFLKVHPNPFNPSCRIEYNTPLNSSASLRIFTITGELIKSFENLAGKGSINWNGTNQNNIQAGNGIYFAVLSGSGKIFSTEKLILLK